MMSGRRKNLSGVVVGGLLLLSVYACDNDPSQTRLSYMPDMADAFNIAATQGYIDPPVGSVSKEYEFFPEDIIEAEKIKNPFAGTKDEAMHLAAGKKHFETFCTPCHAEDGKGNGTIIDKFPKPPDLTLEATAKRGDGFYFHRMTFGSALMPAYGYALYSKERWETALYVRTLQKKG